MHRLQALLAQPVFTGASRGFETFFIPGLRQVDQANRAEDAQYAKRNHQLDQGESSAVFVRSVPHLVSALAG